MMPENRRRLPVTMGFLLALDEAGDLFESAERLAALHDDVALHLPRLLMVDILAPLFALDAVCADARGARRLDGARLWQLGLGGCGLGEAAFLHDTTLEGLLARVKARQPAGADTTPPGPAFLAMMQALFPDRAAPGKDG